MENNNFQEYITRILESDKKYVCPPDLILQYGTAGFRDKAEKIARAVFRMGILATLRSKKLDGATIGIMITASHNPEDDNGVKLIDPHGEMLDEPWEVIATELANCGSEDLGDCLKRIITCEDIDTRKEGIVVIGYDTRLSSVGLRDAILDGINCLGGKANNYGLSTTPMIHFVVRCHNTKGQYGEPSHDGYFRKLCNAFEKLHRLHKPIVRGDTPSTYSRTVYVDGANGVGAPFMENNVKPRVSNVKRGILNLSMYNDLIYYRGRLNVKCGADFVKVKQCFPDGVPRDKYIRCASFDGDADRIVYSYIDGDDKFHLLDGDKIAVLVASYMKELVQKSGCNVTIGVVQTAYANGNSTRYITDTLKVPVECVKTGVKHLHKKALEYDVGIYFEANGHGTVLFSDHTKRRVQERKRKAITPQELDPITKFSIVIDMINETVGDAISDFLLVETILRARLWSVKEWDNMYQDLPNRLLKVEVKDRNVITTEYAETVCVTPIGMQQKIDELVQKYSFGRAFARPSGTENVVRVYAEAETSQNADELAVKVAQIVYDFADGIGSRPVDITA